MRRAVNKQVILTDGNVFAKTTGMAIFSMLTAPRFSLSVFNDQVYLEP